MIKTTMRLCALALCACFAGCEMTPNIATSRIDEEDVEIVFDASRQPNEAEMAAITAEAELRCGKYDRDAEYVSERYANLTPAGSYVIHLRYTFLFQCVPRGS